MLTAIGRTVSTVVHSPFVQQHWKKVALGVTTLVLLAIAAYAATRKSAPQTQLKLDQLPAPTIPWAERMRSNQFNECLNSLVAMTTVEPSSKPFQVGKASYIAWGPGYAMSSNETLKSYVDKLAERDSAFVINLQNRNEGHLPSYYLNKDLEIKFNPIGSVQDGVQGYRFSNNKELFNFVDWKDEQALDETVIDNLIHLAHWVAGNVDGGKTPFIHCTKGLQRTTTFIAIVEMIRRKGQVKNTIEDRRTLMGQILEAIARSGQERVPNTKQLEMLMREDILLKLTS